MTTLTEQKEMIEIRGMKMECYRKGKGQPMLILHGCKDPIGWHPYHERLSKSFDVIAPSYPGFGDSERNSNIETVDDLAYVFLDLIRQLELTDVLLTGMDLGGWIAAEMAVRSTERICGLVLSGAVGIKVSGRETRDIADVNIMAYEHQINIQWHDPEKGKRIMIPPAEMPDDELEIYARNQESETLYTFNPFMHNPDLRKRLYRIDKPAAVVWGENDLVVSANYGRVFAEEMPNATFVGVSEAGHLPHLEQPERFAKAILDFTKVHLKGEK